MPVETIFIILEDKGFKISMSRKGNPYVYLGGNTWTVPPNDLIFKQPFHLLYLCSVSLSNLLKFVKEFSPLFGIPDDSSPHYIS